MRKLLLPVFVSFVLLILQTTLVNFITLGNAIPDLLLIWIVYVAITRGQMAGTLFGFFIGLLVDIIAGEDGMLGLSTLVKSLAGFSAGYFFNENKTQMTLSSSRFLAAVGVSALVHYGVYFLIFLRGSEIGWWQAIAFHGVPSTLYTTTLAVIPMWLFRRTYQ